MQLEANDGKALSISVDGVNYERLPLKSKTVFAGDDLTRVVVEACGTQLAAGDILFVTEKIVAITQGRSYLVADIVPRRLALLLASRVQKTPAGIGLSMPETMEMALRECGVPRILLASAVAAVTKAFGRRGDFYRIAGPKARGIDGPTPNTIAPYNTHVVLAPSRPSAVAATIAAALGDTVDVAIVDINDLGGNVLGSTLSRRDDALVAQILRDNPLGQGSQSTPLGIIRRAFTANE